MSSSRFMRIADRVAKQDKDMLDALVEFEKTGRIRTKERLNFTLDKGVASKFRKFCRNHGFNMSAKVEEAIKKMVEGKND
ncbi:hypothetical protein GF323_05330 [Candidatus Woesearchaeota archaeon]|nr:hypothetical protein [Candidatus Woesearchaeota archaeon]